VAVETRGKKARDRVLTWIAEEHGARLGMGGSTLYSARTKEGARREADWGEGGNIKRGMVTDGLNLRFQRERRGGGGNCEKGGVMECCAAKGEG